MSEQKHAPEPWKLSGTDNIVAAVNYVVALDCRPQDARRIVACVNACAGYSTEALELAASHGKWPVETDEDLRSQRDQLLAALKDALEALESYAVQVEGEWGVGRSMEELERCGEVPACIVSVRAAIAAVEAGK